MIGKEDIRSPYTSQRNTPKQNIEYIGREREWVSFVFIVLIVCGKKAMVVLIAATIHMASIIGIYISKFVKLSVFSAASL